MNKISSKPRDIHKIEKNISIGSRVFDYEDKVKYSIYVSKKFCDEKHVDLLLIDEADEKHYVLIKNFNTFIYYHTCDHGRKIFSRYCLQTYRTAEKLKFHVKQCLKLMVNEQFRCLR